jgi:hypothetical protein
VGCWPQITKPFLAAFYSLRVLEDDWLADMTVWGLCTVSHECGAASKRGFPCVGVATPNCSSLTTPISLGTRGGWLSVLLLLVFGSTLTGNKQCCSFVNFIFFLGEGIVRHFRVSYKKIFHCWTMHLPIPYCRAMSRYDFTKKKIPMNRMTQLCSFKVLASGL